MKKTFNAIICAFIAFQLLCITVVAKSPSYSWYCVHCPNNKQPSCDPSMRFIEEHGGYYIDKKHNDESPEKVIYLTFDAGYENGNVAKILDVLKSENVEAAFFILKHLIENDKELILRMADEGHTVCNHTATHRDMTKIQDPQEFYGELKALEDIYYENTGRVMAKYYRPPEGKFTLENLMAANEFGYKTVFWSFAYADWDNNHQMSAEAAKKKILSNIHNGAILLLHPTSATNALILQDIIKELKLQGYRFGTLDELTKQT